MRAQFVAHGPLNANGAALQIETGAELQIGPKPGMFRKSDEVDAWPAVVSAEREGFEPSVRFNTYTAFPVPHLRPLGHLSGMLNLLSVNALRQLIFVITRC